jgi:anaerobic magnesium-protoporphyrin IX monomethyl ester cyclase
MSSEIKFKGLDENLPKNSALRRYLALKVETATRAPAALAPEYVSYPRMSSGYPRTLLVMPPITLSEGTVKRVIPPLGLCYIASSLEAQGIPCEILDCVVEGLESEELVGPATWRYGLTLPEIEKRLRQFRPEVIGLSILYSSDLDNLLDIARIAKRIDPAIVVVAGGIHPSIYPEEVLAATDNERHIIDFVLRGEGEERMASFLRNLKDGLVDVHGDGLSGRIAGKLFINAQRETIADIDALPFPAYHKLPMERYFEFNVPFSPFPRGKRVMQVYTSRGCPVGCTFCASTNFNKAYRARSVDNVIDELKLLKRLWDIDEIQFADDNLTFNRARSIELFTRLRELELPWCTPNGIMVNTLTKELLDLMIASGLYQITLSLDSGNAKTLKEHHRKPVNLQRVPDLMEYLKERGVLMHGTLVIGMPGESRDDIAEGFRFVEQLPFNSIGVFIAQALPGSELYEVSLAKGAITSHEARTIDTARSGIRLSDISSSELETMAAEFLYRYNQTIRARDPAAWERKYKHHQARLAKICIGKSAPNTAGIIRAAQPTPIELPA